MLRRTLRAIAFSLLALPSTGCHHHLFGSKAVHTDGWQIQGADEIHIIHRRARYPAWAGSELTYADVVLETRADGEVVHRRTLARREQTAILKDGPFKLGVLEARSTPGRDRVWIVDREAHRVIASHDRRTKITTGINEQAPAWAGADAGDVLERLPPRRP